jgi:hypothetical protein
MRAIAQCDAGQNPGAAAEPTAGADVDWGIHRRLARDRSAIGSGVGVRLRVDDNARSHCTVGPDGKAALTVKNGKMIDVAVAPELNASRLGVDVQERVAVQANIPTETNSVQWTLELDSPPDAPSMASAEE